MDHPTQHSFSRIWSLKEFNNPPQRWDINCLTDSSYLLATIQTFSRFQERNCVSRNVSYQPQIRLHVEKTAFLIEMFLCPLSGYHCEQSRTEKQLLREYIIHLFWKAKTSSMMEGKKFITTHARDVPLSFRTNLSFVYSKKLRCTRYLWLSSP